MITESPLNKWMIEYANLLVKLHQLIGRDEGDSDAADLVRDEMDLPWRRMSEAEIGLMRDLSVDLYAISDSSNGTEPLSPEFKCQINDALHRQNYVNALQLIRNNQSQLDVPAAAFLRGICWAGLGLSSAAAEFFLHAERFEPGMLETRLCVLSSLVSGGREKEALDYAERWVRDSDDPALALKAAEVLFLNAVRHADEQSRHLYSKSIKLAERALATSTPNYVSKEQVLMALLQMAVAHLNLGDIKTARECSLRARQHNPDSVIAMMVDGMLSDAAPPVSNAGKLEVARHIAGGQLDADSPLIQHSQHLQQICTLN